MSQQIPLKQSEKTGVIYENGELKVVYPVVEVLIENGLTEQQFEDKLAMLGLEVAAGSIAYPAGRAHTYQKAISGMWYDEQGNCVMDGEAPEPPSTSEEPAEGEEPPAEVPAEVPV